MKRTGFAILLAAATCVAFLWHRAGGPSWYGVAAMSLFALKIVFAWTHKPVREVTEAEAARLDALRIGVAVPVYNEDPKMLAACLKSLLDQDRPVQSVVVIDDCSADKRAYQEALRWVQPFANVGIRLVVDAFEVNKGKREGLMRALELQPDADLLMGLDSDTVLDVQAVGEVIKPFADPRTTVSTGLVLALNNQRNVLTRLIDLRYSESFLVDRAAYSAMGSVLCACGSLALYRTDVLQKYRHDFLTQTFLGRPAIFGDDRRLTNYCLLEGRSALQESAIAFTAVPERLNHFLRQQVRWNKSFFRESLWVLRNMPFRKPAFWLTFVELGAWGCFSVMLMSALLLAPLATGELLLGPYLIYLSLLAYARAFRYFELTGTRSERRDITIGFAIAPLYGLVHIGLLLWLRFYALFTLRRGSWGTRASVEVELQDEKAGGVLTAGYVIKARLPWIQVDNFLDEVHRQQAAKALHPKVQAAFSQSFAASLSQAGQAAPAPAQAPVLTPATVSALVPAQAQVPAAAATPTRLVEPISPLDGELTVPPGVAAGPYSPIDGVPSLGEALPNWSRLPGEPLAGRSPAVHRLPGAPEPRELVGAGSGLRS
ncbi:MAG: glycosyltransferase [Bifidobacteriaceae bacterium]|jgi:hyaluronan synthase|nr:glycosyltransferase [Bifidobacteriaceae bacterium]